MSTSTPQTSELGLSLARLPEELLLLVLEQCTTGTLYRLCLSSRRLETLCRPLLYTDVDLSWHNSRSYLIFPPFEERMDMQLRQFAFLRTLQARPDLARHVRRFAWTLFLRAMKCLPEAVLAQWAPEDFYRMLQQLTGVRRVDLNAGPLGFGPPPHFPRPLFPLAADVSLGGKMHYSLAAAVLHHKAVPVRRLRLYNVVQVGWSPQVHRLSQALTSPAVMPVLPELPFRGASEVWADGEMPAKVATGPMRRLLAPLAAADACRGMESLEVTVDLGWSFRSFRAAFGMDIVDDFVNELAVFVAEVGPETLVVEYGGDEPPPDPPAGGIDQLRKTYTETILRSIQAAESIRPRRVKLRGVPAVDVEPELQRIEDTEVVFEHQEGLLPIWSCPTLPVAREHFQREPNRLVRSTRPPCRSLFPDVPNHYFRPKSAG